MVPEQLQTFNDALDGRLLWLNHFVAKHSHVRGMQCMGEIDVPFAFIELSAPFDRVRFVQMRRGSEIREAKIERLEVFETCREPAWTELSTFGQIDVLLKTSQLDRGKAPLRGILKDCFPGPLRAAQRGKGNWQGRWPRGGSHH